MKDFFSWEEVQRQGICVKYQPIYSIREQRITALEALFRVRDGEHGWLDPESVVHDAEDGGWISTLDLWTLQQACGLIGEFMNQGVKRINVNFSPFSFVTQGIEHKICAIMDKRGIPHSMIWLELTEFGGSVDDHRLQAVMETLEQRGFKFSMDDFVKGESNFLRLLDYDFHVLKLDKALVWSLEEKRLGESALTCIIDFAKKNDIMVTAEGVETAEQARFLMRSGCNNLQGYLISKPLGAKECLAFLERHRDKDLLQLK